jgi:hypothetical protein
VTRSPNYVLPGDRPRSARTVCAASRYASISLSLYRVDMKLFYTALCLFPHPSCVKYLHINTMPSIYSHNTNLIVVTADLLKRMVWGTHFRGPQRLIVRYDLYLHGLRKCKGELLECGHIVIPSDGSRHKHRRCPLCHRLSATSAP